MADQNRIEELRRRVRLNPASIAFATLAEEYRRAGQYEEAVATCRAGLRRHPSYLSPRVTLGRALLALGRSDEARIELERALDAAPDNLAARRALARIEAAEILRLAPPVPPGASARPPRPHVPIDPALPALEAFLAAIRQLQTGSGQARAN